MKKYHYDLRRYRVRPATAGFVGCVYRSDSLDSSPPGVLLRTLMLITITKRKYLANDYSVVKEQARGMADKLILQLGWEDVYASLPHPSSLSRRICPSTIQYIFRGKVAVCYKISLKYFSRLRNPASIERVIRLLCVPSALAISALLMPRKKCA